MSPRHQRPPVLSCLALPGVDALHRAAETLADTGCELLPVSTCQRHELFVLGPADAVRPEGASLLATQGDAAARLFELCAGVRSAVPGERAVDAQLRAALRSATREGLAGPRLARLAQRALRAGASLRDRVERTAPIVELSDLVTELVAAHPEQRREGRRVVLLGAGAMARSVHETLSAAGIGVDVWATRRPWAHRSPCVPLDDLASHLERCGVLISAVPEAHRVVDVGAVPRSALVIDLGVPSALPEARWTPAEIVARFQAKLAPQAEALGRAAHRIPALAESALAESISPSVAALADAVARFREGIVELELGRLAPVLEGLGPEQADRVRRSIRHTAARSVHPLLEHVNQLGRQGRIEEAVAMIDHMLASRVGFTQPVRDGAATG